MPSPSNLPKSGELLTQSFTYFRFPLTQNIDSLNLALDIIMLFRPKTGNSYDCIELLRSTVHSVLYSQHKMQQ